MDENDQKVLSDFYINSIKGGYLTWNLSAENGLCEETGVLCDFSNPRRVVRLLNFLLPFLPSLNYIILIINSFSFHLIEF